MSTDALSFSPPSSPPAATPRRYHPALVALHWLTFLLILGAYFFRGGEEREGGLQLIPALPGLGLHIILGLLLFIVLIIRLVVRWRAKRPAWASTGNAFLDKVGESTHWALYIFMFGILITGLILGLQGNRIARAFGLGGFSDQGQIRPGQFQPGQFPRSGGEGFGEGFRPGSFARNPLFLVGRLHGLVWVGLFLLIALHVGAALYHQFILKDNLLGRMWFGRQTT